MRASGKWFGVLLGFWMHQASGGCLEALLAQPRKPSQYLIDAARYLIGNSENAATVYQAYKRRIQVGDASLPYPLTPSAIPIPETLEELWADLKLDDEIFAETLQHKWTRSDSKLWSRRLIKNSKVKGKPRILYRRKAGNHRPAISIAQTESRETEIAVPRTGSKDWDFYVYDEKGKLAAESVFYTRSGKNVRGPAPLTCLTCHYNRNGRRFGNLPLSYTEEEKILAEFGPALKEQ